MQLVQGPFSILVALNVQIKLTDLLPVESLQHFGQLLENSWVEDEQTAF